MQAKHVHTDTHTHTHPHTQTHIYVKGGGVCVMYVCVDSIFVLCEQSVECMGKCVLDMVYVYSVYIVYVSWLGFYCCNETP